MHAQLYSYRGVGGCRAVCTDTKVIFPNFTCHNCVSDMLIKERTTLWVISSELKVFASNPGGIHSCFVPAWLAKGNSGSKK